MKHLKKKGRNNKKDIESKKGGCFTTKGLLTLELEGMVEKWGE